MQKFTAFLLVCMLPAAVLAQTFTEKIEMVCGDTFRTQMLGYPTWNPPQIIRAARFGHAETDASNRLVYRATPYYRGSDTVVVACARATQITCDTGIYIFRATCADSAASVAVYQVPCGDSLCVFDMSSWGAPMVLQKATKGNVQVQLSPVDGPARFCYRPNAGFEGTDFAIVRYYGKPRLYVLHVSCKISNTTAAPTVLPLRVSPNPATGLVRIDMPESPVAVRLVHASGSVTDVAYTAEDNALLLDLTPLPTGVYALWVQFRHGQGFAKIVVW
jgi:hypothetical protein